MIEKHFPKKRIKFYKRAHKYVLDKETELCSVTTWIKSFFEPFNEMSAACATAAARRKQGIQTTATQVMAEWKKSRTDGTKIHKEAENFIEVGKPTQSSKGQQAEKFIQKMSVDYDLFSEQLIYDGTIGLAGTADLIAVHKDSGMLVICDWKTNNRIYQTAFKDKKGLGACSDIPDCNFMHYTIQLSTYAYLLSLKGYQIKGCILVHLKEGESIEFDIDPKFAIVEAMLKERNGHDIIKTKKPKVKDENEQ